MPRARNVAVSRSSGVADGVGPEPAIDAGLALDPFSKGLLSLDAGQNLLGIYLNSMVSRFPFVVVPVTSVSELHAVKPDLCLAVLTVACFEDAVLQRELGLMFNRLVSTRLLQGTFATLELLQALLVVLAWCVCLLITLPSPCGDTYKADKGTLPATATPL